MSDKYDLICLLSSIPCESELEGEAGSCSDRRCGQCREIDKLSACAVTRIAEHLLASFASLEPWVLVTERMPEERKSFVPGLGTVSKPVLVTWMDPTSEKAYPDNCFVREGITRNGVFTITHINGDLVPVAWMPLPKPFECTGRENV